MPDIKTITANGLYRRGAVVAHDLGMVVLAWVGAHVIGFTVPTAQLDWALLGQVLPVVVLAQGLVFRWMGLYLGLWRFASVPDLWTIVRGAVVGTLVISLALLLYNRFDGISRASLLLYLVFLVFLLATPRLVYRTWKDRRLGLNGVDGRQRVLILGAGRTGERLVHDMFEDGEYRPLGFLDDKKRLLGARVHGVPVMGPLDRLPTIVHEHQPDLLVIAMPSATTVQMQRVVELCEETGVPFRTVPKLQEMMLGQPMVREIREVAIEDLLDREPVTLDWCSITEGLAGKTVLVSGGGGSIGSELCRQIGQLAPASLVIVEHSEFSLYRIDQELRLEFPNLVVKPYLVDVTDAVGVDHVMSATQPDVIFHAAAYKHVPLLQSMARPTVRNNVVGTKVLAQSADRHRCETFVLVSTDKAVNPTNMMGATKRVAELFCQDLNSRSDTRFITVRFGNVLGSTGSVVPLFKQQIKHGGPVTVTHPEITRYFMTVSEACQLIMQGAAMGRGGEIFVLDMGKPIRIAYLAEQMIRLSGKIPGRDIKVTYTGLRPGEKLHEELFYPQENLTETGRDKILLAHHRKVDPAWLSDALAEMEDACRRFDEGDIKALLKRLVPELYDTSRDRSKVVPLPATTSRKAGTAA